MVREAARVSCGQPATPRFDALPQPPVQVGGVGHAAEDRALYPVALACGLTPELSRPARCEPVASETAKRARLERIVS